MTRAGFWRRLGAYAVDVIPIVLLISTVSYLFLGFDRTWRAHRAEPENLQAYAQFLLERNRIRDGSFLLWILYCAVMEASPLQGTLGKRLMHIRVVGREGQRLTRSRAMTRNVAKLTSYLPLGLGFLWAAFSKEKRTWHDMIAKTDVVRDDPERKDVAG